MRKISYNRLIFEIKIFEGISKHYVRVIFPVLFIPVRTEAVDFLCFQGLSSISCV